MKGNIIDIISYVHEGRIYEQTVRIRLKNEKTITAFVPHDFLNKEVIGKAVKIVLFLNFPHIYRQLKSHIKKIVGGDKDTNNEFYGKVVDIIKGHGRKIILDFGIGKIKIDYRPDFDHPRCKKGDYIWTSNGRLDIFDIKIIKHRNKTM